MCNEDVKLYTPEEVADLLGFKTRTIKEWLRSGKLPGIKVGVTWRVRQKDLAEFLEKQKSGGETSELKN